MLYHLSHIVGWVTTAIGLGELLAYPARKSRISFLKHLRGKHHMAWGKILLVMAALHGLFCGKLSLSGLLSLGLGVILLISYQQRKRLGKGWLKWHRIAAVLFGLVTAAHIALFL